MCSNDTQCCYLNTRVCFHRIIATNKEPTRFNCSNHFIFVRQVVLWEKTWTAENSVRTGIHLYQWSISTDVSFDWNKTGKGKISGIHKSRVSIGFRAMRPVGYRGNCESVMDEVGKAWSPTMCEDNANQTSIESSPDWTQLDHNMSNEIENYSSSALHDDYSHLLPVWQWLSGSGNGWGLCGGWGHWLQHLVWSGENWTGMDVDEWGMSIRN